MRRAAAAACIAAALALAGCSSWDPLVWVGLHNEPAHKATPLAPIKESVKPTIAWSTSVGKSLGYQFRPAADGAKVFAANGEGAIVAIDEATGRVGSRIETKKRLSGGLTVGAGKIIVGTPKGDVIALDESGKVLWTTPLAGEIIAPAAMSSKVVVARTSDGRIFGLAADDGKRLWVFQRQSPSLLLRSDAGVLVLGNDVVAGYPNGKLIALDIEDGKLTWEVTVSLPRGTTELERIADVAGLPVVDGNNVCAVAFQGKLACFEVASRNLLWSKDLSSSLDIARDAKNLYVVDDAGKVHALARSSGATVWTQDKLAYRKLSAPVMVGSNVVVGDSQGYVHVLATDNGEIVGRIATDGSAIAAIIPAGSGVIVQTDKGSVISIRL